MHPPNLFLLLTLCFCVNGLKLSRLSLPPGLNLREVESLLSMVDPKTCGCSAPPPNPRCEIAIPQARMIGVTCKKGVFCCRRKRLGPPQPTGSALPPKMRNDVREPTSGVGLASPRKPNPVYHPEATTVATLLPSATDTQASVVPVGVRPNPVYKKKEEAQSPSDEKECGCILETQCQPQNVDYSFGKSCTFGQVRCCTTKVQDLDVDKENIGNVDKKGDKKKPDAVTDLPSTLHQEPNRKQNPNLKATVITRPKPKTEVVTSPKPIVEVVTSPKSIFKVVTSPKPIVEVVTSPKSIVKVVTSPKPIVEVVTSPKPIVEVVTSPKPKVKVVTSPKPIVEVITSPKPKAELKTETSVPKTTLQVTTPKIETKISTLKIKVEATTPETKTEISTSGAKTEATTVEPKGAEKNTNKVQPVITTPNPKVETTTLKLKVEIPTSNPQVKTTPSDAKDKIETPKIQTEKVTINKSENSMAQNSTAKPQLTIEISSELATPKQQVETTTESVRLTASPVKPVDIPENLFTDVSILGRAPTQGKTNTTKSVKDVNNIRIQPKNPVIRPLPTKNPIRTPTRQPLPPKPLTARPAIRRNGASAHPSNGINPTFNPKGRLPTTRPSLPRNPGFTRNPGFPRQPGFPAQPGFPRQPGNWFGNWFGNPQPVRPNVRPNFPPTQPNNLKLRPNVQPRRPNQPPTRPNQKPRRPNNQPNVRPNNQPNVRTNNQPNIRPNNQPNVRPNVGPNNQPNIRPNVRPNNQPNVRTNKQPNIRPNNQPNVRPNLRPNNQANLRPNIQPNVRPINQPNLRPNNQPNLRPNNQPLVNPNQPQVRPTQPQRIPTQPQRIPNQPSRLPNPKPATPIDRSDNVDDELFYTEEAANFQPLKISVEQIPVHEDGNTLNLNQPTRFSGTRPSPQRHQPVVYPQTHVFKPYRAPNTHIKPSVTTEGPTPIFRPASTYRPNIRPHRNHPRLPPRKPSIFEKAKNTASGFWNTKWW